MSHPRLRVALPASICENGDTFSAFQEAFDELLAEWACMLDPVLALRQEYWLATPWALAGTVAVTPEASARLREVAHDPEIVDIFRDSLEHHSLVDNNRLIEEAMPVVLGLAITRTVQKGAGEQSLVLRERLEHEGAWLPASGIPTGTPVADYRSGAGFPAVISPGS